MAVPVPIEAADDAGMGFSHCFTGECRSQVLPLLFRVSSIMAGREDLERAIAVVLATMRDYLGIRAGMAVLFEHGSMHPVLQRGFGAENAVGPRAWEPLVREVVETGRPAIRKRYDVPGCAAAGGLPARNPTVIGAPIVHAGKAIGALAVARPYLSSALLRQDLEFLAILASIMAPAARRHILELHARRRTAGGPSADARAAASGHLDAIIGSSTPMAAVYDLIAKVASTRATVLILGESGVGKELVAQAIHRGGSGRGGPFVACNCAALPEGLVESALFGHEQGAFTGAHAARTGIFEQAEGGTVFLDEIGELGLPVQAKLLRALQERTIEHVGGNVPTRIDARFVCATNRDLLGMVAAGAFREDLYYRINVFPIAVPPLRERGDDIVLLAEHFAAQASRRLGRGSLRLAAPALDMLLAYRWPGNVRELENVIERAAIMSTDGTIHGFHLPQAVREAKGATATAARATLQERLAAIERGAIMDALQRHRGNVSKAATELGLTRSILGLRMEKHGIDRRAFRPPA